MSYNWCYFFISIKKEKKYRHVAIIVAIILLSKLFPQMIFALKRNKLMARKTSTMPTLFKRSKHGCYCFRRVVGFKRTTINTNTTDYTAAKQFLRKYLQGESATALAVAQKQHVSKIASAFAQAATGQTIQQTHLIDAFAMWQKFTPALSRNSERYKHQLTTYFNRFYEWCQTNSINYLEEIDHSVAMQYRNYLLHEKFTVDTIKKQLRLLSCIVKTVQTVNNQPICNPFTIAILPKNLSIESDETSHLPLEPQMITTIMHEASQAGKIWLDLFIVGMQTGMRLKDAALLKWDMIHDDIIEFQPEKTIKHGNIARVPVSPVLRSLLQLTPHTGSPYVNPEIAKFYLNGDWVTKRSKKIFEKALGKQQTQYDKTGLQRQRNGCIRSFHSFRVTFMSLLASKQVPIADAMAMLGWESVEMVRLYTKLLEKAKGDMDNRNKAVIQQMQELVIPLPQATAKIVPCKADLQKLINLYSNVAIGKIYGVSDVAIHKWMQKFGIVRTQRLESPDMPPEVIDRIRLHIMQGCL
ncbi:MAG: hypothetical protein E7039_11255 [Lentisphaerae bacterium]|nr:hypothetical protein [Lentisphaerota bacterium]